MPTAGKEQRSGRQDEEYLSVTEAIREAMDTSTDVAHRSLRDLPATEPHLPLRKVSAQKLQQGTRAAPRPLWTSSSEHQVRGFNPRPVQPLPHVDNITASSEHAFAGREKSSRRRLFQPPLDVQSLMRDGAEFTTQYAETQGLNQMEDESRDPPSSPLLPRPPSSGRLRSSKSVGEGLRGLKHRFSSTSHRPSHSRSTEQRHVSSPITPRPNAAATEQHVRESFRSVLTSNSSILHTSSINTDHSSFTGNSSTSDFVHVYPNWPDTDLVDGEMSVEDAIGMYEDGFSSARQSTETMYRPSLHEARPSSQPSVQGDNHLRPNIAHRRSQSASLLDRLQKYQAGEPTLSASKSVAGPETAAGTVRPSEKAAEPAAIPRDRYGFKKASQHIKVEQYDAWDAQYSPHLERRRKKWHTLMRSYGLSIDQPFRFPPKSDKIKRYVRKGISHDLRGPAWFWYAGGPGKLAKEAGLYKSLVQQVEEGKLTDNDREHIERDLNRTFPDNIRFKPDPATTLDAQADAGGGASNVTGKKKKRRTTDPETPILRALRRVLQAFAVHNPSIGYCQSLNFIAGLLLLVLDEDEEKAFVLLNIVTSVHLPGTHGVALEGANIDIAVLMSCIHDALPAIWARLDDKGGGLGGVASASALRLPTVSLATTAWFMSLFVGTLPIEAVFRVWDCLFFEGSKTLFRIALAIFKFGEKPILAVTDPMEIFQVVQTIPRSMLDVNGLMEVCFRRRGGFGHVSQEMIERRREERRKAVRDGVASVRGEQNWLRRVRTKTRM